MTFTPHFTSNANNIDRKKHSEKQLSSKFPENIFLNYQSVPISVMSNEKNL